MLVYLAFVVVMDCKLPRALTYFFVTNVVIFIYLFSDYYRKAYYKPKKLQQNKTVEKVSYTCNTNLSILYSFLKFLFKESQTRVCQHKNGIVVNGTFIENGRIIGENSSVTSTPNGPLSCNGISFCSSLNDKKKG